jgi:hypothetical protein
MSLTNELDRLHDMLSQEQMKYVSKLKRDSGDDSRIAKYFSLINRLLVDLSRFKNMKEQFDKSDESGESEAKVSVKERKQKIEKKVQYKD